MTPRLKFLHILSLLLLTSLASSQSECPEYCKCTIEVINGSEEVHVAKCNKISGLKGDYGKRSNINTLDLSNIHLQKLTLKLDNFKYLTELNLSNNNLTEINISNKKITHLNLANNLLSSKKLSKIPEYVEHLDLSNNKLVNIPDDVMKLTRLQSLELSGNTIDCNCENIIARNWLQNHHIWSEKHVQCKTPKRFENMSWLQIKEIDVCQYEKKGNHGYNWKFDDDDELMLADEPAKIFEGSGENNDDLGMEFIPVSTSAKILNPDDDIENDESSGAEESFTVHPRLFVNTTDDPDEGSGDDGSGFVSVILKDFGGRGHLVTSSPELDSDTTIELEDYENRSIPYEKPGIFDPNFEEEKVIVNKDTESNITGAKTDIVGEQPSSRLKTQDDDTGLYILLVVIGVVFIALLIVVAVRRKSQTPSKRSYDPEAANQRGKELQPMNKNNIGKPADHEYIPLMGEKPIYKPPNSADTPKLHSFKPSDEDIIREPLLKSKSEPLQEQPLEKSKSKSSLYENVPEKEVQPPQDTQYIKPVPAVRTQTPDILPKIDTTDTPNGNGLIQNGVHNGNPYQNDDDVFLPNNTSNEPNEPVVTPPQNQSKPTSPNLSTSRYSPVYSPETGRVKVKLIHTPKPKTPLLVNRTRSAAGDIIDVPQFSPRSTRK